MKVFSSIKLLRKELDFWRAKDAQIGFVPTMGALHKGHLSIIEASKNECDVTVVSIYVNPLQFNVSSDLKNYPRTIEEDKELLHEIDCDILFLPATHEMFPEKEVLELQLGNLDTTMEGQYRPGHLDGMATVIKRFFEIIHPKKAYFGEKDYQQLNVVRKVTSTFDFSAEIVACPTYREENGLAMSSRNILLSDPEREQATVIYRSLKYAKRNTDRLSPVELKIKCTAMLEEHPLKVEYFEIADSSSLEPLESWQDSEEPRAFVAAYLGKVRLIDNMSLID